MSLLVTVSVITYNQELYIAKTIQSILNQVTNFDFEIIIHDDASTDRTPIIIREFMEKNPEKIRAILEEENQYSKGVNPNFLNYEQTTGKYIALCEGDDYWIDENKLQKQVDYLEKHPNCTFCFTNGIIKHEGIKDKVFIPYYNSRYDKKFYKKGNRKYYLNEMYQLLFIPTASIMFPRSNLDKLPASFYEKCGAGDLKMRLFYTAMGYAYFIDDNSVVYRENAVGSMMLHWSEEEIEQRASRDKSIIAMIDHVNEYSEGICKKSLYKIRDIHIENLLSKYSIIKIIKNRELKNYFIDLSGGNKIRLLVKKLLKKYTMESRR